MQRKKKIIKLDLCKTKIVIYHLKALSVLEKYFPLLIQEAHFLTEINLKRLVHNLFLLDIQIKVPQNLVLLTTYQIITMKKRTISRLLKYRKNIFNFKKILIQVFLKFKGIKNG